jgi:hypothetical protein
MASRKRRQGIHSFIHFIIKSLNYRLLNPYRIIILSLKNGISISSFDND